MSKPSDESWQQENEKGNILGVLFLMYCCRLFGRRISHLIVAVPVLFFYLSSKRARKASKSYLRKIKSDKNLSSWKHFYYFAKISLDRLFFISGETNNFRCTAQGTEIFETLKQSTQGAIIALSHVGSFDALRASSENYLNNKIFLLLDTSVSPNAYKILCRTAPDLAKNVIDRSKYSAPALGLRLQSEIQRGSLIGIMADRIYGAEQPTSLKFLGQHANFPLSPWQLALILKAPVVLACGLFLGGNHYQLRFRLLPPSTSSKRSERQTQLENYCNSYVEFIEENLQTAPYNWMNFYDFWTNETA